MTGDIWKRFQGLLPAAPLEIGTISAVYAGGVYVVDKLSGGQIRTVSNDSYRSGQRVFVQDGEITGEAPELPQVEIEV